MMDMDIRPIATEADYTWALAEIEPYFENEPEPGTPEAARFDVLAALIEHYEDKHWHIDPPGAVDAIRFRMEQGNLGSADLAQVLGSDAVATDVLNGSTNLTLEQVRRLHRDWGISLQALVG